MKETGRRVATFTALVLAAVVTNALPLPWQVGSLAFLVAALVVGVRALLFAWRQGVRGVMITLIAVGLSFTAVLAVSMVSLLALWPVQLERQECLRGALTVAATQQCDNDFQQGLEDRLRGLGGTSTDG